MNLNKIVSKLHFGFACSVAAVVAGFYAIAVPLQTYLANQDMFEFSVWSIVPQMLLALVILFLVFLASICVLSIFLGQYAHFLIILLGICGFLEVGILSIGLPPINGMLVEVNRPSFRKIVDYCVFLLIFAGGGGIYCKIKPFLRYILLSFLILVIASIFDSYSPKNSMPTSSEFASGICEDRIDVWKSATFSSKRNIIMLVVDMVPGDIALEVLESDGELKSRFNGFVAYRNNIGMHDRTLRGVPSLVSGSFLEKDEKTIEHLSKFYDEKKGSIIPKYLHAGYTMYIAPQFASAYTNNRKSYSESGHTSEVRNKFFQYTKNRPFVTLWDIVRYRLLPWREKGRFIEKAIAKGDVECAVKTYVDYEDFVYSQIMQGGIDKSEKTFHYYHTAGVHIPICRSRDGKMLGRESMSVDHFKDYMHYILVQVAHLIDYLKENGIYDQTQIILTTDHGLRFGGISASHKWAMLWVKPIDAQGEFEVSDVATSHSKISTLMGDSVLNTLSKEEITKTLYQPVRRLRVAYPTPEKWWYFGKELDSFDFIYDEDGNEVSRVNLGRFATW